MFEFLPNLSSVLNLETNSILDVRILLSCHCSVFIRVTYMSMPLRTCLQIAPLTVPLRPSNTPLLCDLAKKCHLILIHAHVPRHIAPFPSPQYETL